MTEALHIVCPHCHTTNRVQAAQLHSNPDCGSCHRPLFAGEPLALDAARWQTHALDRLQAWGFNTIGNWSDPALAESKRVPYTLPLSMT